jgi:hypothetical protein
MKIFKIFSHLHFPWSKPSLRSRILSGIAIFSALAIVLYSLFTIPNQISRVSTTSRLTTSSCQNNIKSLTLDNQCGNKSFRSVSFECLVPSSSSANTQLNPSACYTTDYLYNVANQACSNCAPPVSQIPKLLFSPSELRANQNTVFTVNIQVDTANQPINGVGAQITFDPTYIQEVSLTPGTIFANYPTLEANNTTGTISISGISSSLSDTFTGIGTVATISFKIIKTGTSNVNFIYTPGATNDSNIAVTTGNGDILGEVNTLKVMPITPPKPTKTPSPPRRPYY